MAARVAEGTYNFKTERVILRRGLALSGIPERNRCVGGLMRQKWDCKVSRE